MSTPAETGLQKYSALEDHVDEASEDNDKDGDKDKDKGKDTDKDAAQSGIRVDPENSRPENSQNPSNNINDRAETDATQQQADGFDNPSKSSPVSPLPHKTPPASQIPEPFPQPSPRFASTSLQYENGSLDVPPLEDSDDEDLLPTIEKMMANNRPEYTPIKEGKSKLGSFTQASQVKTVRVKTEPGKAIISNEPVKRLPLPRKRPLAATHRPKLASHGTRGSPIDVMSSGPESTEKPRFIDLKRKIDLESANGSVTTKRSRGLKHIMFTKHPSHWYLDGNVVIQIDNVRYKLHRSKLVQLSDWFRDYFEAGTRSHQIFDPDEGEVIVISHDNVRAKDFNTFLDALDEAISFFYKEPGFLNAASILRVSATFSFSLFRDWSMQYVADIWSNNLDDLDTTPIPFATEAVLLARQFNISNILKRSLYELVRTTMFGQPDTDEDSDAADAQDPKKTTTAEVSQADLRRLVKTRQTLTLLWALQAPSSIADFAHCAAIRNPEPLPEPVEAANSAASDPCTTLNPLRTQEAHRKLVIESGIYEEYLYDPICGFKALMDAPWLGEGFCKACVAMRKKVWKKTRARTWQDLDRHFAIESV